MKCSYVLIFSKWEGILHLSTTISILLICSALIYFLLDVKKQIPWGMHVNSAKNNSIYYCWHDYSKKCAVYYETFVFYYACKCKACLVILALVPSAFSKILGKNSEAKYHKRNFCVPYRSNIDWPVGMVWMDILM